VVLVGLWSGDFSAGGTYLTSGWMLPTFVLVLVTIGMSRWAWLMIVALDFFANMRAVRQYRKAGKLA
jgi:hypothetical protein